MRTPILAAALFSGAFLGQLQQSESRPQETLEIRELRIVDAGGEARVVLSVDDDGDGRVEVLGPDGRPAHFLGFDRGHALYDLHGPAAEGQGRAPRVRVTTDSAGGVWFIRSHAIGASLVSVGGGVVAGAAVGLITRSVDSRSEPESAS